ncbi:hypothetical protein NDU88_002566, partial [Pleurodeles waltl]
QKIIREREQRDALLRAKEMEIEELQRDLEKHQDCRNMFEEACKQNKTILGRISLDMSSMRQDMETTVN